MVAERGDDGKVGGWAGRAVLGGAVMVGALVMSASLAAAPRLRGGVGPDLAAMGTPTEETVVGTEESVPEEAAAAPATSLAPVETGAPVATAPEGEVELSVPPTLPLVQVASRDLLEYFTLLDAGRIPDAFERLTIERQAELGGLPNFEGLWNAVAEVAAEVPVCVGDPRGMACTLTVQMTGADGSCAVATNEFGLQLVLDRFRIATENSLSQQPCVP